MLLYSTASDVRIVNTSKLNKVNTIVKDLKQGSAVDFHYRKNLVCWSDQTDELIQCMKFNDTYVGEKVSILICFNLMKKTVIKDTRKDLKMWLIITGVKYTQSSVSPN